MVSHPGPGGVRKMLADGLALEAAGWKRESDHAVINSPRRLRFFTELAEVTEANHWLRLGALYMDGRLIAFNYDLEYAGRMVGLVTAYDETLPRRCSRGISCLSRHSKQPSTAGLPGTSRAASEVENPGSRNGHPPPSPRVYVRGFGPDVKGRAARSIWEVRSKLRELHRPRAAIPAQTT